MIRANLLPPPSRDTVVFGVPVDKKDLFSFGGAAAVCLVLLLGFNFALISRVHAEQNDLDAANSQIVALMSQTNDVGQLSSDVRRLQEIDRDAIWLKRSGQIAALRLAYLGNAIPRDAWVDRISQDSHGWAVRGAGKSLNTVSGVMRGLAAVSPGLPTLFQAVTTEHRYSYQMTIADPTPTSTPTLPQPQATP